MFAVIWTRVYTHTYILIGIIIMIISTIIRCSSVTKPREPGRPDLRELSSGASHYVLFVYMCVYIYIYIYIYVYIYTHTYTLHTLYVTILSSELLQDGCMSLMSLILLAFSHYMCMNILYIISGSIML